MHQSATPSRRKWFSSLRWKLTFSYTLVTVATLVTFEILILLGVLVFLGSNLFANLLLNNLKTEMADHAVPYLTLSPPDSEGLQIWLNSLIVQQTEINLDTSVEASSRLKLGSISLNNAQEALYILAPDQTVLAQLAPSNGNLDPTTLPAFLTQNSAQTIINRAAAGETENGRLFHIIDDGSTITAVPIKDSHNQVVGIAVLTFRLPILSRDVIVPISQAVLLTTIPLTLGAVFIGTIFGFFTSRGLTKRINRLTQAAAAWSQGNFSVVDLDSSGDELGDLSRRLNWMAEQLHNLLDTSQELATVEERNRLARDLHDSIKQQLFATTMQLGAASSLFESDPASAKTHLITAEQLANQAQKELTGLIQELRPVVLEGRGLPGALKAYLADWSTHTGIKSSLRLQNEQTLPLAIEQPLFRVAQEALANIARHSQAQSVEVHAIWEHHQFTLSLSDDGIGFDPLTNTSGVGLKSMKERLLLINGRLNLTSQPQQGTTIQAIVPL